MPEKTTLRDRVAGIVRYHLFDEAGRDKHALEVADLLLTRLRSQLPSVAFKGPDLTDAKAFQTAADKLRLGYDVGGSNMRSAVAKLLDLAAEVLDSATEDEVAERARAGWGPRNA